MGLTITQSRSDVAEKKVTVTLAGGATIATAGKIKEGLLAALIDCEELLLDVGELTSADPALLQLIHATRRTAGAEGKSFLLGGAPAAAFHDAAIAAGFLPEDIDANKSA